MFKFGFGAIKSVNNFGVWIPSMNCALDRCERKYIIISCYYNSYLNFGNLNKTV